MKKLGLLRLFSNSSFRPLPDAQMFFGSGGVHISLLRKIKPVAAKKPSISRVLYSSTTNSFILSTFIDPGLHSATATLIFGIENQAQTEVPFNSEIKSRTRVMFQITPALPNTRYNFEIIATNQDGTSFKSGYVDTKSESIIAAILDENSNQILDETNLIIQES